MLRFCATGIGGAAAALLAGCAHAPDRPSAPDDRVAWLAQTLATALERGDADAPQGPAEADFARIQRALALRAPLPIAEPAGDMLTEGPPVGAAALLAALPEPLAPVVVRTPAPAAPAPATGFAVELGAFDTADLARLVWAEVLAAAPLATGGLAPQTPPAADGRVRLVAGPIPDAAAAEQVCAQLRRLGVACTATEARSGG